MAVSDSSDARPKSRLSTSSNNDALVERARSILSKNPSALVTDIDGTISPIASTPAAAFVIPEAREALRTLVVALPHVAIVTGRTAEDAERMVDLGGVLYIGNHGFERRWQGETRDHSGATKSQTAIEQALNQIERELLLEELDEGILLENKKLSGAVHYRLAPAREMIGPRIGAIVAAAAAASDLRMTEGRYVYELRPPITVNKGTAALDLIEDLELKGIIFLGDDVTDVDAFREIRNAARNGLVDGLAIAVNSPEVRQIVIDEADAFVEGVPGVVALLTALADYFERSATSDGVI
jgi:trehalose 6-phosphate phosphatase